MKPVQPDIHHGSRDVVGGLPHVGEAGGVGYGVGRGLELLHAGRAGISVEIAVGEGLQRQIPAPHSDVHRLHEIRSPHALEPGCVVRALRPGQASNDR